MEVLSLDQLDAQSAEFDACVAACPEVDLFCTSTDWTIPAARAFGTGAAWIRKSANGYVALMHVDLPNGAFALQPLEAVWGLACPVVGADPDALALDFAGALAESPERSHVLLLCGVVRESPRFVALVRMLAPRYELRLGPSTRRYVASLRGGVDGFLSRRTANFRDSVRKARRRARERGVEIVAAQPTLAQTAEVYERLLAVERESWKGHEGHGLEASSMVDFYREMVPRLVKRGALRLLFARRDGVDLAYILGGTFGATYRGLQFSFREGLEDLSLGNLLQLAEIERLSAEGIALYDLGTDVEYKKRWGEIEHDTVTVIALPR
ncbi:MAG TPA: GNAT family N-acetyltransferase [bacterium]|nr:GNAT family N-acetyltransferase [bacterium]